ncbi:hypothetical protein DL96DRAFT_1607075 [Flagelloscypha sp. PMI_526]|nr:hypothetical protein DL96DRAFT_1607075 [Flagelloscypha sp. PMI_526]
MSLGPAYMNLAATGITLPSLHVVRSSPNHNDPGFSVHLRTIEHQVRNAPASLHKVPGHSNLLQNLKTRTSELESFGAWDIGGWLSSFSRRGDGAGPAPRGLAVAPDSLSQTISTMGAKTLGGLVGDWDFGSWWSTFSRRESIANREPSRAEILSRAMSRDDAQLCEVIGRAFGWSSEDLDLLREKVGKVLVQV